MRVIATDSLDPPADVASDAHCISLATDSAVARRGEVVRGLVRLAEDGAVTCPKHADMRPWREASAHGAVCSRACTELKTRSHSQRMLIDGKHMVQRTAACVLCPVCAPQVYGVSKTAKVAEVRCCVCMPACIDAVSALTLARVCTPAAPVTTGRVRSWGAPRA